MRKFFLPFLAAILMANVSLASNKTYYVSPGIGISWDLQGNLTISPKLSVGYLENGNFYNLTVGRNFVQGNDTKSYYYLEGQAGVLSEPMEFRKIQVFSGVGLGFNYYPGRTDRSLAFRASAFSGFGGFLKATVTSDQQYRADFGLEGVLPVPLNFNFGSIGG